MRTCLRHSPVTRLVVEVKLVVEVEFILVVEVLVELVLIVESVNFRQVSDDIYVWRQIC